MMYAVLDIETTGGKFNEEGITEIAIYKFDGHDIVDQFISLVNPEIPIQAFVVQLTGINNAMLKLAPKFHEIAKRIVEITNDCVIVAHNAPFDYRILKTEFRRLGYDFNAKTLCTVELSKILLPEQPSHSLGKLVRALGIPIADRHRASGDAIATLKLFKLLLEKDMQNLIVSELIKSEISKGIAPKLQDILDHLPSNTGVYYIHDTSGKIIYIGISKNIKKRLTHHFTGVTIICKKIQAEVFNVTYAETGSELIAQIKEAEELKTNDPILNRNQAKKSYHFALYAETDKNEYLNLKIGKFDRNKSEILLFSSPAEAKNALIQIMSNYQLCQKSTGIFQNNITCYQNDNVGCNGNCQKQNLPNEYNIKVQEFIAKNTFQNQNIIIVDRGRSISEKSAVLVENGICIGYAFYDLNYQIHKIDILKNILIPVENKIDIKCIVQRYLRKSKSYKIITF